MQLAQLATHIQLNQPSYFLPLQTSPQQCMQLAECGFAGHASAGQHAGIAQTIAQADKTEAASLAHKLKGVAGNLGLTDVAALAAELDQALQAGDDPTDALNRLQGALDTALTSIDSYAPPV